MSFLNFQSYYQGRIEDPSKHLRWSFLRKQLMAISRYWFPQDVSIMDV